MRVLKLIL